MAFHAKESSKANAVAITAIVFGVGFILFFSARSLYRSSTSTNWPTTVGIVTKSFVDEESVSLGEGVSYFRYTPKVRYKYTVDGKRYTSDLITYYPRSFRRNSLRDTLFPPSAHIKAEQVTSRYHEDQAVTVYYLADDPSLAVLNPGVFVGDRGAPIGRVFLVSIFVFLVSIVVSLTIFDYVWPTVPPVQFQVAGTIEVPDPPGIGHSVWLKLIDGHPHLVRAKPKRGLHPESGEEIEFHIADLVIEGEHIGSFQTCQSGKRMSPDCHTKQENSIIVNGELIAVRQHAIEIAEQLGGSFHTLDERTGELGM